MKRLAVAIVVAPFALLSAEISSVDAAREAGAGIVRGETASGKKGAGIVRASSERTDSKRKWAPLLRTGLKASGQGSTTISDVRVAPLIKSRWNQLTHTHSSSTGLPCYNYYTPNGYPCGCGATSFAQIVRYFQWPTNAVPAKSYSVFVDNVAGYRYMIGGPYDWANMPLRPWEGEISDISTNASLDGLLSVALDTSDPAKFVIVKPSLEEVAPLSPLT